LGIPVEAEILQHQHRLASGDGAQQCLQIRRDQMGEAPGPAGGGEDLHLERTLAPGHVDSRLQRLGTGVHAAVLQHRGEGGGAALVGLLGVERHLGQFVAGRQVGAGAGKQAIAVGCGTAAGEDRQHQQQGGEGQPAGTEWTHRWGGEKSPGPGARGELAYSLGKMSITPATSRRIRISSTTATVPRPLPAGRLSSWPWTCWISLWVMPLTRSVTSAGSTPRVSSSFFTSSRSSCSARASRCCCSSAWETRESVPIRAAWAGTWTAAREKNNTTK